MLVTTTSVIEGGRITRYFGIVSGETIIGANVFRDFFASIRDVVGGRSGSYEEVLREAKDTALREMQEQARMLGANAVIGVDLDYETVGGSGSMLGAMMGVIIIGVLTNGIQLIGMDSNMINCVKGIVLLIAIGIDSVQRTGKKAKKV